MQNSMPKHVSWDDVLLENRLVVVGMIPLRSDILQTRVVHKPRSASKKKKNSKCKRSSSKFDFNFEFIREDRKIFKNSNYVMQTWPLMSVFEWPLNNFATTKVTLANISKTKRRNFVPKSKGAIGTSSQDHQLRQLTPSLWIL